jgi:hypothetical protein
MSRGLDGGYDDAGVLRIYSDPAGAANVMREVVARPKLSARLLEDGNGRWQVAVHGGDAHERVLGLVLDIVHRFVEEGRLQFATLEFAGRSITLGRPVAAVAAA